MPIMTSQILKSVHFTKTQKSRYHENEILFFLQIKKIGITKPYSHLYSAPPISTQLSVTPSTLLKPKYLTQLGNFPKFSSKNSKLSIFTEN